MIKKPWIDLILEGKKTWEIRSRPATVRGAVGLIESGSGHVVGVANVVGCVGPLSQEEVARHFDKHRVPPERMSEVPYERFYAWELSDVRRLTPPVPYVHPSGAVIWVRLDASTVGPHLPRLLQKAETCVVRSSSSAPSVSSALEQPQGANDVDNEASPSVVSITININLPGSAHGSPLPASQRIKRVPSRPAAKNRRNRRRLPQALPAPRGPFGVEWVVQIVGAAFGKPTSTTQYAYRWSLGDGVGVGIDRRGAKAVTAFTGTKVELGDTDLDVQSTHTSKGSQYGVNSNMKAVPGCEPGKVVQRITLRSASDARTLVQRLQAAI